MGDWEKGKNGMKEEGRRRKERERASLMCKLNENCKYKQTHDATKV
jgi:hypothetical protein